MSAHDQLQAEVSFLERPIDAFPYVWYSWGAKETLVSFKNYETVTCGHMELMGKTHGKVHGKDRKCCIYSSGTFKKA